MPLVDLPAFTSAAPILREAALKLRTIQSTVTLQSTICETGIFATAIIEAAFLDAGIPYQRRFRDSEVVAVPPCIMISEIIQNLPTAIPDGPFQIQISPLEVEALVSSDGDTRHGVLSTVAIAAALAELIEPDGALNRLLRPWALAGNWLSGAMQNTYDPVYTVLRDYLSSAASIRVVPLPEVPDVNLDGLAAIDSVALDAVRDRWGQLDLEGRAQALSHLIKLQLESETPSTARLEELVWHRIMNTGWEMDLASQLNELNIRWRNELSQHRAIANEMIDKLLRTGHLI